MKPIPDNLKIDNKTIFIYILFLYNHILLYVWTVCITPNCIYRTKIPQLLGLKFHHFYIFEFLHFRILTFSNYYII